MVSSIFKLRLIPIFSALWLILTFVTTYIIAVQNDHVYPLLPYISDTGALAPESCVFGQGLNIGALLCLITVYLRYRVVFLVKHEEGDWYNRLNEWSLIMGCLVSLGISIVANFQETNLLLMHFFGAFLAFGVGAIYCIVQAFLTWQSFCGELVKYLRTLLSITIFVGFVLCLVFTLESFEQFDGVDSFKWTSEHRAYGLHLVATFSEWATAAFMGAFFATFYHEFGSYQMDEISLLQVHGRIK